MKKITFGFSVIAAASLLMVACNKKTNTAPTADMEFQSSKDAAYATSVVTELEVICSYMGENLMTSAFLTPAPGSPATSSITTSRDTVTKVLTVTFTNTVLCMDGKKRNGTITLNYSASNGLQGAKFYRDAGFVANVTLNNYVVDGWMINTITPFNITNNMAFGYNPSSVNLNWTLDGNFTINNLADSTRNMSWKGKLIKTLTNSNDAQIMAVNKLSPINWTYYNNGHLTNAAKVSYKGVAAYPAVQVNGVTSRSTSYSLAIKDDAPLMRDFICAPDGVVGVLTTTTTPVTVTPVNSQWHPFINGTASFTTGTLPDPRLINWGAEDGSTPCDNAGTVTIKGISYSIDFQK